MADDGGYAAPELPAASAITIAELPALFLGHLKEHPEMLDSIRAFQGSYRHCFVMSSEEYTHEQQLAYQEFLNLVDGHLSAFLAMYGATEDDFSTAMQYMKETSDPHWMAFDLMLRHVEFETFAALIRQNTCLCCGGQFQPDLVVDVPQDM
eukprot:gnl/TRDRNA2_/TRDRNA2_176362_c3_seq1.p1 gnl/TRDRNA2_/TRDRNA2_176362_c3~~gnl/TRDRNA2_/TRDRNA2_176362_c3_seq1.p1  ORF type:complete len:151 (+),score=29.27 gnl/TRDRNA2_/TRDRNA2_176362_c3_seq1:120-572(+)